MHAAVPDGAEVIAYADDTMIVMGGRDWTRTLRAMEAAVAAVIYEIRKLGLTVSTEKTEAVWIHGMSENKEPPETCLGEDRIRVKPQIRYLGIILDGRLSFKPHVDYLRGKVERNVSYLSRILPNLFGPGYRVRKLYSAVINAMVMYGAPVWAKYIGKKGLATLITVQRPIALRVARAYRTTPTDMLFAIAGMVTYKWQAAAWYRIYRETKDIREAGEALTVQCKDNVRNRQFSIAMDRWKEQLKKCNIRGRPFMRAIINNWEAWVTTGPANLTYRITQLMSGHGCFASYLKRIGARRNDRCIECMEVRDSAIHTVFVCKAFDRQKDELEVAMGERLSINSIVKTVADGKRKCKAVQKFAKDVMQEKEENDREDERNDRIRQNRKWRRKKARKREEKKLWTKMMDDTYEMEEE